MKMDEKNRGIASYNSLLNTLINDFLKNVIKETEYNDIVPSHGEILEIVYKNGGRVQIKTICDTLSKQKTTVTEMINRLVQLGYLKKENCTEDKRATYVVATEKAIAYRENFDIISQQLLNKVFKGFSEEEQNEFTRLMLKAIKNFN